MKTTQTMHTQMLIERLNNAAAALSEAHEHLSRVVFLDTSPVKEDGTTAKIQRRLPELLDLARDCEDWSSNLSDQD